MRLLRPTFLFLICYLGVLNLSAQTPSLTGRVMDAETNEPLIRATAQLYRIGRDTTLVGGTFGHQARVRLSYYDRANSETVRQSAIDDL